MHTSTSIARPREDVRRRLVQPVLPNLYFKDGLLSIPGFTFDKAVPWEDTGSQTLLAEGTNLKDGSNVLAKLAPATGSGAICLEREAHILDRLSSSSDASNFVVRVIDFISLPRESGDCVVLLLSHPGVNVLGRYFPPSKVNELLLSDTSRPRPSSSHGDIHMMGMEESGMHEELELFDIMDLATFLEFAIQATHCLEVIHKEGIIHREVRANAFHLNAHAGLVRFAHFGNRSISLEQLGGPSALVIAADTLEELSKHKVKEALCYLAPEQTGSVDTSQEDHRTDLYSLGIMFWTLLVGQGQMPFEGSPMEILHAIAQKRPMPVHEFRRDIPHVVALIIEKLLNKSPDSRYNSAYGLKADLLECQRRLLTAVSSMSEQSLELIPFFEIGKEDKFMGFTIPNILFGREKELETIRSVIRRTSASHARQYDSQRSSVTMTSSSSQYTGNSLDVPDEHSDSAVSSRSESSPKNLATVNSSAGAINGESSAMAGTRVASLRDNSPGSFTSSQAPLSSEGPRSRSGRHSSRSRVSRTRSVIVAGPAGAGKSSLILTNQAKWRSHGLWGHAKFQNAAAAPFAALLSCLSSVLRQLMIFQSDLHRFVMTLRTRLGPLLHNAPLLYQGAPELKDVLQLFDVDIRAPKEALPASELRVRFQTLVEQVFAVIAEVRLLALFLDDLHEADESSLDLIQTLANSKSQMLILASVRTEEPDRTTRLRQVFGSKSRVTWINLEPLGFPAVSSLVAKTLHSSKEKSLPLSRIIFRTSGGNAFSIRNFLFSLQRHHHIVFDWEQNCWTYDLHDIEASLVDDSSAAFPNIQTYLTTHWRELLPEARKYLLWASFFGTIFKAEEVASVIDWEDSSSGSSTEEDSDESFRLIKPTSSTKEPTNFSSTRTSMKGLQAAIAEGWLVQRARDMCSFSHDRYRQAAVVEAEKLSEETIAKMSFRIVLMLLHEQVPDPHRVAEHAKRCMNVIREHPVRSDVLDQLYEAGTSAWTRGAHELALESLRNAQALLIDEQWETDFERTFSLLLKLSELYSWKGDLAASDEVVMETLRRAKSAEDKARCLRLRSRNKFARKDFAGALDDTLSALEMLGIKVNPSPSKKEVDVMFEQVKNEILAVGFENILKIPRTDNIRIDLTVQLLNDAGMNAYWNTGDGFSDVLGLTTIQVALRSGMCPGTAIGFFWALGAAAERRDLYRFSADLGRLGLRIAEAHGTSAEKCRSLYLYCSMVSGYDNLHIKANISRCEMAVKYGLSAGDRLFAGFALIHGIMARLFTCEHLSELVQAAEEATNDITLWTPQSDTITLARGVLNLIRALGGYTIASSAETAFDTESFNDAEYVEHVIHTSGNVPLALGWYNAFKVVGLFCLGYIEEAAELGFSVFESLHYHPNHRHTRFALCYHSLAMISCIRERNLSEDRRSRYLKQIDINQAYIRKWLSPSPINTSTWVALVDAELASIRDDPEAFKLYDVAVKLACNNDWLLEEGWALYFQGCHFVRCGVEGLGSELRRRGISRQSQWGARGIVNYLTSVVGTSSDQMLKKTIFTSDVAVQTDALVMGPVTSVLGSTEDPMKDFNYDEEAFQLTSSDLAAILRWSKDISSDINLSSALRRLTEIATENSGAQCACVVIAREAGDYTVATSMYPPKPCQVHENPKSIRTIADPLQRTVIQHCLNSKSRIVFDDTTLDSRFASEAQDSQYRAVICLPIFSNRGQTFGVVYLASRYTFLQSTVHILTLLLQQASISISNALLFRSVQAGTRENLKMISLQRAALEEARKSREDALKATKIKSNFLASMSHELRTPFSSFYGLLDILSGTDLNPSQLEIVSTAKESCELLLKIIDSILDYSKLEASALKLEMSGFPVENIIADCMELLLPMAAKKLDMSFNIEPEVPLWVNADYARIRQVLMNLIGNAVKFTASGSVKVICSVDSSRKAQEGEVYIRFVIQDTGIGLSKADKELLFVPFQQADNSSTRKFGGTGLGLSISRQLVKLMGGEIGVDSEPGVGSVFWFSIPVKIYESDESKKGVEELEDLKTRLLEPQPPRILITTPSDATAHLLENMLNGFSVSTVGSIDEAEERLHSTDPKLKAVDFIVVDHQSEARVDEIAKTLQATKSASTAKTKIIHLFTPTAESLSKQPTIDNAQLGIVRMTKPPRRARLLQTLAALKDVKSNLTTGPHSDVMKAMGDLAAAKRTVFGNVLIAEDNPVAQQLLVMQLERNKLIVTATSNGEEAVHEWESHEPGHFSIALFDHHMPICDGIEACKRIRLLENKRKVPISLPIIALSADCQDSTKQLCLSAGMNAFLSKPLKKGDLVALLSMLDPA